MLPALRPIFHGDWAPYGESLQLADADADRISVAQWLAAEAHLEAALTRHAESLKGACDRKAVASNWMMRYLIALLPPVVALASLLRYRVPAGWHEMQLALDARGSPSIFTINSAGSVRAGADTATRYDPLIWQHLAPLISLLARQTKLPTRLVRANVRRALLGIFEQALALASADPALSASLREDRRQLLNSSTWPDGRRNPLFLRHREVWVADLKGSQPLTLHASCCLAHRLPDTAHCVACPIAPQYLHRAATASGGPDPTSNDA